MNEIPDDEAEQLDVEIMRREDVERERDGLKKERSQGSRMNVDYFLNSEYCCGAFVGGCDGKHDKCGQWVLANEVKFLRAQLATEVKLREEAEKERDDLKTKLESWREKCDVLATQLTDSTQECQELQGKLEAALAREAMLREALMSLVIEAKPIFRFCKQRGDELLSFPWAIRNADKILNEGQGE